ncbi:hypothetical protein V2G26_009471 [Clonostachys chloroleuca]
MLHLPNEILEAIASWLETQRDIYALVRTSRQLRDALNSTLYRRNVEDSGGSALTWAVDYRREETAIKAIRAGAPGGEALWCSVFHKDEKMVKLILSSDNADGNFQDSVGDSPLLAAVRLRNDSMLKLLLGSGKVKVDLGDWRGRTPLFNAAGSGYTSGVELLLDSDESEMRRGNDDAYKVLDRAIERGHAPVVKLLMEYAGIAADSPVMRNSLGVQGQTPLCRALY